MEMNNVATDSVRAFLSGLPIGAEALARTLAVPALLTDELASFLCEKVSNHATWVPDFLDTFARAPFSIPGHGDWRLNTEAREYLLKGFRGRNLLIRIHELILLFAQERLENDVGAVPTYLREPSGLAYHIAITDPGEALRQYSQCWHSARTGQIWFAGVLAEENEIHGLLPPQAIEAPWLRGYSSYTERDWSTASRYFSEVIRRGGDRLEVAIALHLIGRQECQQNRHEEGERHLRESIEVGLRISAGHHVLQVRHTISLHQARLNREEEREQMLLEGLEVGHEHR